MRLARLSLAALVLITFAACNNDATAPELTKPSGPVLSNGTLGSGLKANSDTLVTSIASTGGATSGPVDPH